MTALLTGDPGALSDLVYVQRSLNRLGADRTDVSRELVTRQADAGAALARFPTRSGATLSGSSSGSRSRAVSWPIARPR
jgi:hypothetical protein